ncbi:MAG: hypothetical protein NE328_06575, partial [Lentisphaeraceae bacterium]|nr:hypothetical protein [Lentisphaeraceae bacterium]
MKYFLTFIFIPLWIFAEPSFEKEIAPIFETHCISCHNDEKTKGKFNLSNLEKMLANKKAVKPGDSTKSTLLAMVSGDEPEMPPKGVPLNRKQVNLLKNWIDSGAKWPQGRVLEFNPKKNFNWWSLKPLQSTALSTKNNPVDFFINELL